MSNDILIKGKSFTDGEKTFRFKYEVRDVIKIDSIYVVLFYYMETDHNVDAYDLEGNHLWNINDILKHDCNNVFMGMHKAFDKIYVDIPELGNYIAFYVDWGILYYVDVISGRCIAKEITK